MQKVLITGSEGMLGLEMCQFYEQAGVNVYGVDIKEADVTKKDEIIPVIIAESPDIVIQFHAVKGLAEIGTPDAVKALVGTFKLKDKYGKKLAAKQLARLRVQEAVPELTKLLDSPDWDVRIVALDALAQFGDKRCIPKVKKMLMDSDPRVKKAAGLFLKQAKAGRETSY